MSEQRLVIEWRQGMQVTAAVEAAPGPGVVLAHGAGGSLETSFLVEMSHGLAARGIASLRFNFPYSEQRRRVPDPPAVLEACYRAVALRVGEMFPGGVFLGGKSMGGRIASQIMAGAEGLPPVRGLVFLGYPLHPPGKQDRLRDKHLYLIRVPMLFVQGTRDTFAGRPLLQGVLDRLGDAARVHWIEGANHSFKAPRRKPDDVNQEILETIGRFVSQ